MADPKFPIPDEYRSELRFVEALDKRSDEEILESLTRRVPISSEKNIWAFWHAGVRSMPAWCQRNVVNWIRLCGPSWTVRFLDNIPNSPNNALTWLNADVLPKTFVEGTMKGPHTGPHAADFLRGALIFSFGGVWMDVGIILFRRLDDICWKKLEDPNSPFEVCAPWSYGQIIGNYFIAGRKGNVFIKHWHDIFMKLWEGRTSAGGITANPLLAFVKDIDLGGKKEIKEKTVQWQVTNPSAMFDYMSQVLAWTRVCLIEEPNGGFNGREYWASKVLLYDYLPEDFAAEDTVGFTGQDVFNALATKRDAEPSSKEYQLAHKMTWRMLSRANMQKIVHGGNLLKTPALGVLWDKESNEGKDIEPGTFAELLRYGSVHFEQTRQEIGYVEAPESDIVLKEKVLQD